MHNLRGQFIKYLADNMQRGAKVTAQQAYKEIYSFVDSTEFEHAFLQWEKSTRKARKKYYQEPRHITDILRTQND